MKVGFKSSLVIAVKQGSMPNEDAMQGFTVAQTHAQDYYFKATGGSIEESDITIAFNLYELEDSDEVKDIHAKSATMMEEELARAGVDK